jgi:hypothetical protein
MVGIAIATAMLNGPSLLTFYSTSIDAETGIALTKMFEAMIPVVLMIVIIVSVVEIVKDAIRMLRPGKVTYPFEKRSQQ